VPALGRPMCRSCATELGRLLGRADGSLLTRIWRAGDPPRLKVIGGPRWHATAARVCLDSGEHALALRHAGTALVTAFSEVSPADSALAVAHAPAVTFDRRIYRSEATTE
jgi:hypothetical protein